MLVFNLVGSVKVPVALDSKDLVLRLAPGSTGPLSVTTSRCLYFFCLEVGDKYQQGIYDGRKLVDKQDVVLVSINYRCGCLGTTVKTTRKTPTSKAKNLPHIN